MAATRRSRKGEGTPFDQATAQATAPRRRRTRVSPASGREGDLTAVTLRYNDAVGLAEDLRAERDEVVRAAIADRVPRARIVEITGLSPQRIDQIRRGARL